MSSSSLRSGACEVRQSVPLSAAVRCVLDAQSVFDVIQRAPHRGLYGLAVTGDQRGFD
jgi:hypothetical protein